MKADKVLCCMFFYYLLFISRFACIHEVYIGVRTKGHNIPYKVQGSRFLFSFLTLTIHKTQ